MDIFLPAYLNFCPRCGKHGHIIFADGSASKEFVSKLEALGIIERAFLNRKITLNEARHLVEQVYQSPMVGNYLHQTMDFNLEPIIAQEYNDNLDIGLWSLN